MPAPEGHEPCHDPGEGWDPASGRYRCGCEVEEAPVCLACEAEWPCFLVVG